MMKPPSQIASGVTMSISVRVSDALYQAASTAAEAELRSIPQQIEFWAQLGRAAFDNPDLPIDLVRDILMSRMVPVEDAEPFVPEGQPGG
jgi:hypothetical protein